jgi:hypothetical protein
MQMVIKKKLGEDENKYLWKLSILYIIINNRYKSLLN